VGVTDLRPARIHVLLLLLLLLLLPNKAHTRKKNKATSKEKNLAREANKTFKGVLYQ
jgi:hypothetical protein